MSSALVSLVGFPALMIHGDTLVLDRWLWLRARLPKVSKPTTLLDAGCGSGAFTIGAARLGYRALGVSWDERNQKKALERAKSCGVPNADFQVLDVRNLQLRADWVGAFDVVICTEVIEHILDDAKLLHDLANCLCPGGRLLLTTPYANYKPITRSDDGPFSKSEDGGHVRRGYSEFRLRQLCAESGLAIDSFSFCSGFMSQKVTCLFRMANRIHPMFGWLAILPLRILPPLVDAALGRILKWPYFCICIEGHKA
jgi:SAM-dependent methyltransferase